MISLSDIPHIGWSIFKAKLGYKVPLKVTYHLTYRCNFKCSFCGRINNKTEEMDTAQIKDVMNEFKELGTRYWGFNGGEPLIRKDIGELICHAKRLGFKCNITTNGWFIPHKIDEIKELDFISISLDGPEEVHDAIRGKRSYEKIIQALEILKAYKIKTSIITVINKTNLDHLEEILQIVEKYNCEWDVQLIVQHRDDYEGKARAFFPLEADVVNAIDWVMEQKKKGKRILNSKAYLESMKENKSSPDWPDCWSGKLVFNLGAEGVLLPCAEFIAESEKFQSVQDGVKKAIDSIPDMSKCRDCRFSCYWEYNFALANLPRTGFKFMVNLFTGKWFWQ